MPVPPEVSPRDEPFPAATRQQWRELIAAALPGGGDPEAALTHIGYDGVPVGPLYTAADAPDPAPEPGRPPFVRGQGAPDRVPGGSEAGPAAWDVRVRHAGADPAAVNAAVLTDLATGANSVWLVVGADALAAADIPAALHGALLDVAPIALDAGADTPAAADQLLAAAGRTGVPGAALRGTLGADPIGWSARTGAAVDPALLPALAGRLADHPQLSLACVDATIYHDAGGSDADEIAVATSIGLAYLRALTDAGLGVAAALAAVEFRFAIDTDQFASIAKLRAARQVWDEVARHCGADADRGPQRQHAVTSAAMLTRRDPWTNLIRATIACFAAAVGGADAITVTPFDAAIGVSDPFARRIARNTGSILLDESQLGRVVDAAGGSWYVESRTARLAERAWTAFTGLERAGGAAAALADGTVATLLALARAARSDDVAHRRAVITGVNEFAVLDEEPVRRPPGGSSIADSAGTGALPLASRRWAADFEELRDRTDAAALNAARPQVVLVALGPPASHHARVSFATGLFLTGGLSTSTVTGTEAGIAGAVIADPADVPAAVCICASPEMLAEHGVAVVRALRRRAGDHPLHIWVAGPVPPPERAAEWAAAGVDGYLFRGCDALAVLRTTLEVLGVPA